MLIAAGLMLSVATASQAVWADSGYEAETHICTAEPCTSAGDLGENPIVERSRFNGQIGYDGPVSGSPEYGINAELGADPGNTPPYDPVPASPNTPNHARQVNETLRMMSIDVRPITDNGNETRSTPISLSPPDDSGRLVVAPPMPHPTPPTLPRLVPSLLGSV